MDTPTSTPSSSRTNIELPPSANKRRDRPAIEHEPPEAIEHESPEAARVKQLFTNEFVGHKEFELRTDNWDGLEAIAKYLDDEEYTKIKHNPTLTQKTLGTYITKTAKVTGYGYESLRLIKQTVSVKNYMVEELKISDLRMMTMKKTLVAELERLRKWGDGSRIFKSNFRRMWEKLAFEIGTKLITLPILRKARTDTFGEGTYRQYSHSKKFNPDVVYNDIEDDIEKTAEVTKNAKGKGRAVDSSEEEEEEEEGDGGEEEDGDGDGEEEEEDGAVDEIGDGEEDGAVDEIGDGEEDGAVDEIGEEESWFDDSDTVDNTETIPLKKRNRDDILAIVKRTKLDLARIENLLEEDI